MSKKKKNPQQLRWDAERRRQWKHLTQELQSANVMWSMNYFSDLIEPRGYAAELDMDDTSPKLLFYKGGILFYTHIFPKDKTELYDKIDRMYESLYVEPEYLQEKYIDYKVETMKAKYPDQDWDLYPVSYIRNLANDNT